MIIKNFLRITFLAAFLATGFCASSVFAQTATSTADIITDLQVQIKALQTRIVELEAELGVRPESSSPKIDAPGASIALPAFGRAISKGMSGDDVRNLQTFLAKFSDLYPEGLVTGYYGPLTEKAVQRWQAKEGIVSSGTSDTTGYGRIGPKTRARLNELIGKKASASDGVPLESQVEVATPIPETGATLVKEDEQVTSSSTAPLVETETAPEGAIAKPPANIKSGTGTARTNSVFDFGTGAIHYKELGRLGESGAFYLGSAGGGQTSPFLFVANINSPKASPCDPHDASPIAGAIGPKSICEFIDAANYTFSDKEELARFHEKSSSCYDGIILFRQNNFYGGIEPEDITKSGDLSFHYWYDASGGSDFSDACLLGKNGAQSSLASVLGSLGDVLNKIQREIKKLSR